MPDPGEVIDAAVRSAEAGFADTADQILRHAVHDGTRPIDLILAALAAEPRSLTVPSGRDGTPMQLINRGPTDLTVPVMGGADIEFPIGEPVEVPEHVAHQLLEQPVFKPAENATAKPAETRGGAQPRGRKPRRPQE